MSCLIIKAHDKAKGGFVLIDKRDNRVINEGDFNGLMMQKINLQELNYGFEIPIVEDKVTMITDWTI